jgi:D-serine deaminase-like pyridoxal phosphate-dependent protein
MNTILHSSVSRPVLDCDTPALLLDLDKVESNIALLHTGIVAPVKLRSHAKAHKCPALAKLQISRGAIGICCQKLSEAEVFFDAGIHDIVISNQVIGEFKVSRLMALGKRMRAAGGKLGVCVDHALGVQQLVNAVSAVNAVNAVRAESAENAENADLASPVLNVWVELDVGQGRCGVQTSAEVLALVEQIIACKALQFAGLQAYHGKLQHLRSPAQRQATANQMFVQVGAVVQALQARALAWGLNLPIAVAGGGTGSYFLEASSKLYTEIQAGSYVLMDADYQRNEVAASARFQNSLTVLCTVMSERPGQIVIDGGLKTFAVDSGLPVALMPGLLVKGISDEHTVIEVLDVALQPLIGKKIELIPGHCDPTVNLHHEFNVVRNGGVIAKWPILAQGAIF